MYLKSAKHGSGVERLKSNEKKEQSIIKMLERYDKQVHPVGEKLPDSVRVHRIKVLTCFLKAGVPLNKMDCFRDLLQESSYRLSSSHHLAEMIPIVRQQEAEKVHSEINGKNVAMVFDGTTHVCEAMVIILRFIHVLIMACDNVSRTVDTCRETTLVTVSMPHAGLTWPCLISLPRYSAPSRGIM